MAAEVLVPAVREAVDQGFARAAEAVDEARVLVFAVEAPAHAVAAVGVAGWANFHARTLEAIPAALADLAPTLQVAIGWQRAALEAIRWAGLRVLALRRAADLISTGVVVANLDACLFHAVPAPFATRIPLEREAVDECRAGLVAVLGAVLGRLAALGITRSVAAASYALGVAASIVTDRIVAAGHGIGPHQTPVWQTGKTGLDARVGAVAARSACFFARVDNAVTIVASTVSTPHGVARERRQEDQSQTNLPNPVSHQALLRLHFAKCVQCDSY